MVDFVDSGLCLRFGLLQFFIESLHFLVLFVEMVFEHGDLLISVLLLRGQLGQLGLTLVVHSLESVVLGGQLFLP